jgi:hypothetical protein
VGQARSPDGSVGARARDASRLEDVLVSVAEAKDAVVDYLGTDSGRRLRRGLAAAVLVGLPVASKIPLIRRTPIARIAGSALLVALAIRGAEWLRDWEPPERQPYPGGGQAGS